MSSKRKRNALYGFAPNVGAESGLTTTCTDPNSGESTSFPAGSVLNNGGPMKFGLYPTVGKSVGFLNLLSNCCSSNQTFGITTKSQNCSTA